MHLNHVHEVRSSDLNVAKYVFDFGNAVAEAVLYGYVGFNERTVICCSTQSGCPVGCRFCGAGDAFVRSLTADEIVEQPAYLMNLRGINAQHVRRLQIMFMSMGEPLLNYKQLELAIRELHDRYPEAALLISTSAPRVDYGPLRELSKEIDTVGLQFSVHESTDEARNRLVPFRAKLTLKEIAAEGERWHVATARPPFFNYCAHEANTGDADADRLLALFNPAIWEATISVVCERTESVAAANERQRELATSFRRKLGVRGFSTRVFDPAGQDDIGGGCGQLWFVQKWMKNNANLARPSVGCGQKMVHAPRS